MWNVRQGLMIVQILCWPMTLGTLRLHVASAQSIIRRTCRKRWCQRKLRCLFQKQGGRVRGVPITVEERRGVPIARIREKKQGKKPCRNARPAVTAWFFSMFLLRYVVLMLMLQLMLILMLIPMLLLMLAVLLMLLQQWYTICYASANAKAIAMLMLMLLLTLTQILMLTLMLMLILMLKLILV